MKRIVAVCILCTAFLFLLSGCGKEAQPSLSPDDATIRAVADAAVMEEYGLDDVSNFEIEVRYPKEGQPYIHYELRILGYDARDYIDVTMANDGSVEEISGNYGDYSVFVDHVTKFDLLRAKLGLWWQTRKYWDEEPHYYLLIVDGELHLCVEIIADIVPPITTEDGESSGCGLNHEHLFFGERLCAAPE